MKAECFLAVGKKNPKTVYPCPDSQIKPVGFFLLLSQLIASLNQTNFLLSFYISESINLHLAESFLQLSESKYKRKKQILLQTHFSQASFVFPFIRYHKNLSCWLWHLKTFGNKYVNVSSVQSLSRVRLFVTPWTAAPQASLSITIS